MNVEACEMCRPNTHALHNIELNWMHGKTTVHLSACTFDKGNDMSEKTFIVDCPYCKAKVAAEVSWNGDAGKKVSYVDKGK
jgi:hypothetical protein